jgi:hypothetical protein
MTGNDPINPNSSGVGIAAEEFQFRTSFDASRNHCRSAVGARQFAFAQRDDL